MIKGGFQGLDISGVDLTAQSPSLPGAYAACQAAEGKTVLVLTAAGAVQCSVKKVSTNYVLAGITGDGKILGITIGSTDGIAVTETAPSEEPDMHPVSNGYIEIGSGAGNAMTVPSDGYAVLSIASDATTSSFAAISEVPSGMPICKFPAGTAGTISQTTFVKKGMKIYSNGVTTGVTARFWKLEES